MHRCDCVNFNQRLLLSGIVSLVCFGYIWETENLERGFEPLSVTHIIGVDSAHPNARWLLTEFSDCMHHSLSAEIAMHSSADIKEHFTEMWEATAPMRGHKQHCYSGYCGPWIENHWIDTFGNIALENAHNLSLRFGIFIPIFVQWTDIVVTGKKRGKPLCNDWFVQILNRLRNDFLYITVIQHDRGIHTWLQGCNQQIQDLWSEQLSKQLLILAGGVGHVPIPILKQPLEPCQNNASHAERHMLGFIGKRSTSPFRSHVITAIERDGGSFYTYHGSDWRRMECECCHFVLTPRGFGRSAFSIAENLQMGNIVVYAYDKYPWLPYQTLWDKYSVRFQGNKAFAGDLYHTMSAIYNNQTQYKMMKEWIQMNTNKYFTFQGVLEQIQLFLIYGRLRSALHCVEHNATLNRYQE